MTGPLGAAASDRWTSGGVALGAGHGLVIRVKVKTGGQGNRSPGTRNRSDLKVRPNLLL